MGDLLAEWAYRAPPAAAWILNMEREGPSLFTWEKTDDGGCLWIHNRTKPFEILSFSYLGAVGRPDPVLTIIYATACERQPGPRYVNVLEPHEPGRVRHALKGSRTEYRVCGHVDRGAAHQTSIF